jgi:hypothetical protein
LAGHNLESRLFIPTLIVGPFVSEEKIFEIVDARHADR